MVIPTLVRQAIKSEPITVFGNGLQTRSFAFVGDVVQALVRLVKVPEAVGDVFNIGNNEEISILALAEKVKALTESPSEIVMVPYEEAYEPGFEDMLRRVPDLKKIKKLLNWEPKVGIDEILNHVIQYTHQQETRQ